MIWLKACARCGGDMYRDWDPGAGYERLCLQCGCTIYESEPRTARRAAATPVFTAGAR